MRRHWGTLLMGGLLLAGCTEVRTYEVLPYQQPCMGMYPQMCIVAEEQGAGKTGFFYNEIVGFKFRWGVTQTIRVRVEEVSDPPQDSSSELYFLEEVVSTEPVAEGTTFETSLSNEYLKGNPTQGFRLISGQELQCATEALCQTLAQRLEGSHTEPFKVVLRLPGSPEQPLIVESVE